MGREGIYHHRRRWWIVLHGDLFTILKSKEVWLERVVFKYRQKQPPTGKILFKRSGQLATNDTLVHSLYLKKLNNIIGWCDCSQDAARQI